MADPFLFTFAIAALLLTPGPSNTLMALSGAQAGLRRTVPLIPVELIAYLIVVAPLAIWGRESLAGWPLLAQAIRIGAALWIFRLALKLWRIPDSGSAQTGVTAQRLFVTTLLNPKALIVGLLLLPSGADPAFPLHMLLFAASIAMVALLWAGLGASMGAATGPRAPWLRRIAASWLALLSGGLLLGAIAH